MLVFIGKGEVAIEGSIVELRSVAEYLKSSQAGSVRDYQLSLNAIVSPYDELLEHLVFDCNGSKIKGSVNDKTLTLEYGLSHIDVIASFFAFNSDSKIGSHFHFDQYGNEEYFDSECIDMIVQISDGR